MTKSVIAERIGCVLKGVKGPDGEDAKITKAVRISEEFPAHTGFEVVFEYYTDEQGRLAVSLDRRGGRKARLRESWTLSAIDSCEAKGLKEFAESLGLKGYNLANLVRTFKPAV
jgi:hypothetical protein